MKLIRKNSHLCRLHIIEGPKSNQIFFFSGEKHLFIKEILSANQQNNFYHFLTLFASEKAIVRFPF